MTATIEAPAARLPRVIRGPRPWRAVRLHFALDLSSYQTSALQFVDVRPFFPEAEVAWDHCVGSLEWAHCYLRILAVGEGRFYEQLRRHDQRFRDHKYSHDEAENVRDNDKTYRLRQAELIAYRCTEYGELYRRKTSAIYYGDIERLRYVPASEKWVAADSGNKQRTKARAA